MAQATFTTPGVSCMSCMAKIEDALNPLEGVVEADVDLAAQQVRVQFDDARIAPDRIAQVLQDTGYEVAGVSG